MAIVVMAPGKSMVCSGNWKKLSYDKRLEDKKKGEVQVLVWPELEDPHQSFLGQLFPAMDITGLQQKKANKQRAVELRAGKDCQASCRVSMSSSSPRGWGGRG